MAPINFIWNKLICFSGCIWIRKENLKFDKCWPTFCNHTKVTKKKIIVWNFSDWNIFIQFKIFVSCTFLMTSFLFVCHLYIHSCILNALRRWIHWGMTFFSRPNIYFYFSSFYILNEEKVVRYEDNATIPMVIID